MATQIDPSDEWANRVLQELWDAETPEACEAIATRTAQGFARLQQVNQVRAIHIVNMAKLKRILFKDAARKELDDQLTLWE